MGWLTPLQSSLFLDCRSSAPCRVVVAISSSFRRVQRAVDEANGPRDRRSAPARSSRGQNNQLRAETEGILTSDDCGQAAAQLVEKRRALLYLSSHTLTVKMYFRETCKFFCTVLIICSILSCRNHCDMSSIK